MTMRVTMTQARMGESGSVLASGTTYTVSDAFGRYLVKQGFATDTDNVMAESQRLTETDVAATKALVSVDGNTPRVSELTRRLAGAFGDETFSRSGANASVIDCYGSMQFALAGEARFYGARRVCNLITDTEGLSTGWALGNTPTATKTAAGRGPNHPRASAWQIDRPLGTSNMLVLSSASYRPGKYILSAWLKGDGVTQVTLRIERSGDSAGTSQVVTPAAGVWTRYAVVHDIVDTSNHRCWFSVTANQVATFWIADPQLEWAHNQASPAPADYVPRGVSTATLPASTYADEAGVDGVRYYDTANPWTLSSGVATRSQATTMLDAATLRGLLLEPAATNQVYSSGALSAAEWSKTGSTTVNATAIDSTVLGKSSLWKIQEAAATEGHRISQSWRGTVPAVNTILSASVYAKAAERSIAYVGIRALDGSTIRYCYFNLATGVVSNAASGGKGWMVRVGDCWLLGWSITAGSSGSTAPLMNFGCCQVAGTENDAGTLNSGMYFGAPQFEAAAVPSSYVGDTASAATLTRNVESCAIVSTSMPAIGWTLSVDYTPLYPTNTPLKDTWWYILSAYVSAADRGAIGLRPAALGGFYDGGEGQAFFDQYPGISADNLNWDGVEVLTGYAGQPLETTRIQWSAGLAAQTGASNQAGYIGVTAATLTGDSPRPAVNSWATTPRTWTLGRQHTGAGQRGPACWKNLSWTAVARTPAQMLAAAA